MFLKKQRYVFFDVSDMFFQWVGRFFYSKRDLIVCDILYDHTELILINPICLIRIMEITFLNLKDDIFDNYLA